jgi:hypothetical protein
VAAGFDAQHAQAGLFAVERVTFHSASEGFERVVVSGRSHGKHHHRESKSVIEYLECSEYRE